MSRPTTAETFWDRCDTSEGPDACWPWLGATNDRGYGVGSFQGRTHHAHRIAFMLWHGQTMYGLTPDEVVMHRCDNPPCCNPHHLTLGTQADNVADCKAKGRAKEHTRGAVHGTYSGYMRHASRRGGWTMPACRPCKDANAAYHRDRASRSGCVGSIPTVPVRQSDTAGRTSVSDGDPTVRPPCDSNGTFVADSAATSRPR